MADANMTSCPKYKASSEQECSVKYRGFTAKHKVKKTVEFCIQTSFIPASKLVAVFMLPTTVFRNAASKVITRACCYDLPQMRL